MLRGRGGTAHLQSEAVVLDRAGIRLVIPLAAIETVHVARSKRPTAEIRLKSAATGADATTVCAIGSRSTEAVEAFAHSVNAAVPQRDEAERRINGAALVKAAERPFMPRTPCRPFLSTDEWWACGALTCLFAVGLLLPALAGDGSLAKLWAGTFAGLVFGCAVARGTWRATVTWWLLHRYGVTTVATFVAYVPGEDDNSHGARIYRFTDTAGATHEIHRAGPQLGHYEIEISYDPARPDFATGTGRPWARTVILLIRLLVGVPVTLVMAAYLLWYFTTAMHP
ncbi:hypothetical protein SMIR_36185 [Streptomyces mirabilis]|uniref:hypothetical protein n=1 Tax=Streptomyces mirabilis TaxID=68239 RepID=UPI001BAFC752|nr:hypothetical protein [Streptomyces mirabilis]QUW83935.1 hypothetical protein SMIR_36185 [Streptomyces mirabilis]